MEAYHDRSAECWSWKDPERSPGPNMGSKYGLVHKAWQCHVPTYYQINLFLKTMKVLKYKQCPEMNYLSNFFLEPVFLTIYLVVSCNVSVT